MCRVDMINDEEPEPVLRPLKDVNEPSTVSITTIK